MMYMYKKEINIISINIIIQIPQKKPKTRIIRSKIVRPEQL